MAIFEMSIMARVTWNLHSLNNEGTIGNVTEPRTVVLASGEKTDGISGEMLKHIHAYNVWLLQEDKSKFCSACQKFHPQRADVNEMVKKSKNQESAMKTAIASCILCDLHGFLLAQTMSLGRPSTIEFGWALGIPDKTHRSIHVHARHFMVGRSKEELKAGEEESEIAKNEDGRGKGEEKQVTSQMVYHRPTRSGVYALISVFQPWRIGLNEINYSYVISNEERKKRFQLALNAYKAALIRTEGAMTSTRLPHVEGIEGAVIISEKNFPAPVISPINNDYLDQLEALNRDEKGLSMKKFSNLADLKSLIDELMLHEIYELKMP
ncbi:MAG: DevR family CRISPR-associated autoregulator [Candidatus Aminicenantes bacterium]|nr:DevR family CRISPR-associated autoregulator [Candidatus Aminicenantes bacterium]